MPRQFGELISSPDIRLKLSFERTWAHCTLRRGIASGPGRPALPGLEHEEVAKINVVLNWFEELKRRVPPGKR